MVFDTLTLRPFSIKIDHIKSLHTTHIKIVCIPTQYTNQNCLTNVILMGKFEYFVMLTKIGKFQAWSAFNTVDTLRITVSSGMTNERNLNESYYTSSFAHPFIRL